MKLEQTEIRALVVEALNEAVAINAQQIDLSLCCHIKPFPQFLAHRNSIINVHQNSTNPNDVARGVISGLSIINALLDKLGVDPLVPLRELSGKLTGFVDMPKELTHTTVPAPVQPVTVAPLADGWLRPQHESKQVEAYRYHPDSQDLDVRFVRGGEYTYHNAPPAMVEGLATAASPGSYLNGVIKKQCTFTKKPN